MGRLPVLVALLLLPVTVAALLVAGLGQPAERLDTVSAAIVNLDKPVKIGGQLAPLGRQLAQAIAHPTTSGPGTYDWAVTNLEDAEAGLADGTYAAVVVIPRGFSRAATSLATDEPHQATIDVRASDRSGLADGVITQNLIGAAQQAFGADLTARYLRNLYVGVGKLRTGLGDMAVGADQLDDGTGQLSDGVLQLSDGLGALADGGQALATGAGELADGAAQLSAGVGQTADGAGKLARGSERLTDGTADLADGAQQLADAMNDAGTAAAQADAGTRELVTALAGLEQAYQLCQTEPARCAQALSDALSRLPDRQQLTDLATASAMTNAYLNGVPGQSGLVAGTHQLATGASRLAKGSARATDGTRQLAAGLRKLSRGGSQLADGAAQLADGTDQLGSGITQAATGADPLSAGAQSLHEGTGQLADGLHQAADQVPSYSSQQRRAMSTVAATPIVSSASGEPGLPWLGAALLVTLCLWVGGILTWLVLPPVVPRAYESSRSSARLAWMAARPGIVVGAAQGLLVGVVVAASLDDAGAGSQVMFVLLSVLAGVAFTAVMRGLMGLFGLLGGAVAVAWGAVALAAGMVSTAPSWFGAALTHVPLGPLVTGLRQVAAGAGFPWGAVVALLVLGLTGFLLTMGATRRRTLRRPSPPAPAATVVVT